MFGAAGRADDAGRHRLAQLKRAADREHPFADLAAAPSRPTASPAVRVTPIFSSAMSVSGSVPITSPLISRLSGSAIVICAHVLADDVVVGDDIAVGRDDDAGAEAERTAIAAAEHLVVAEEIAEERIVGERRVARAHHLQRRDVGDALHRLAGDAGEVRAGIRDGGSRRRGAAVRGCDCRRTAARRAAVGAEVLGVPALSLGGAHHPVDDQPPTKPATTSTRESKILRNMSAHVDAPRGTIARPSES